MDPQEKDRELEKLLDRALRTYSEAEPSWGFEERILARAKAEDRTVREAQGERSRRWWIWWPAWAAVAVIVVAAALPFALRTRQEPQRFETKTANVPRPTQPATRTDIAVASAMAPKRQSHTMSNSRATATLKTDKKVPVVKRAVRRPVFPSAAPTTQQEQALLALMRTHPQPVLITGKYQEAGSEELPDVQEIKIEPLRVPEIGGDCQ